MRLNLPVSAVVLLGINVLPLLGVLYWDWNLIHIIFLYWAESAIIGLFSIFKMLCARDDSTSWPMRILTVVMKVFAFFFFMLHFGGFIAAIGLVLYFFAREVLEVTVEPLALLATTWGVLATMVLSHGFSFVVNFLVKGERTISKGKDPIAAAYVRVIILHLTLAFGLGPTLFLGQPLYLLVVFIILKTTTDLWAHLRERRKFGAPIDA
jgi:hypothetical protein